MKKLLLILPALCLCGNIFAQSKYNLDFEILENETAKGWASPLGNDNYKISYDTSIRQNGKVSASIESINEEGGFRAISYRIPSHFSGKKIKLTGYVKTENVRDGWAGLWLRLDPKIGFDNMQDKGITGTTDWKKYEIELDDLPNAETIVFGGLISGKGKMWFDNLELTIDGIPIDKAPLRELSSAEKDVEFNNGSNINTLELDDTRLANLDLLGRIWGFLKYYHPNIGTGAVNWDYELFRVLPSYLNAANNSERDAILLSWINKQGDVKPCKPCKALDKDAQMVPDLDWITSSNLSSALEQKLNMIEKNRFQGTHYYVGSGQVGQANFTNEKSYVKIPYSDLGFRLLAVYRYWNMIQYYFPYKNETDQNWNSVLKEMISKTIKAETETDYHLALLEMVVKIDDSHGVFSTPKTWAHFGTKFPPFEIQIIDNKAVVSKFYDSNLAEENDIKIGDVITHVNEVPVSEILKTNNKYIFASNPSVKRRGAFFVLFKGDNSSCNVTVERQGTTTSKKIKKYSYSNFNRQQSKDKWNMLDNNIGYVHMGNLTRGDVTEMMTAFKDTKAIIFDIRNYPQGTLYEIAPYLNTKSVDFVKFTKPDLSYPGAFIWEPSYQAGGGSKEDLYRGQVILLVNETTQSHAEFTAMCLQIAENAITIGSQTSGADGNVSKFNVVGGYSTMITGIGIFYPDGRKTQRIGIVPDIEIRPTIKGIQQGRDEVLDKALEVIDSNLIKD
ncbi:S41 family peptidase [uncultured Psychroserpens sp.]|uniref:S41 family peptidase n=1 Tax=uncultured Psychroserpens sp. TaxID=255436 RepID=UPI00262E4DFB|nr:S41 family peptidase [uncultured Psychroserpens sp.]